MPQRVAHILADYALEVRKLSSSCPAASARPRPFASPKK